MEASAISLKKFVIRTFLWLPPSFAAWYFSAPYFVAIAGKLARLLVNQFTSGVVSAIEQTGSVLLFVTTIKVHPTPEQTALLLPEVNALLYSYGLALFLALMLADKLLRAGNRGRLGVFLLNGQLVGDEGEVLAEN